MSEFLTQFMERRGELLELTIEHMEMTSLAVLASLIVGGLIGIAITKNDKAAAIVHRHCQPHAVHSQHRSAGLYGTLCGHRQKPAIIMVVIYALLPIIKNTYTGITGIDPKLHEAASGIGLSKTQQLLRIQLPLALPFIMAGIRISAVTAVGTVTIAAFAGAGGLGWMINMGLNANDANLVLLAQSRPVCWRWLWTLCWARWKKPSPPKDSSPRIRSSIYPGASVWPVRLWHWPCVLCC